MSEKSIRIEFEPIGRRVDVKPGTTILDAARMAGIEIVAICGGIGTCESCKVQSMTDKACSPITTIEEVAFSEAELSAGWRLACQAEALESLKIHIPPESLTTPQRLQLEGMEESPFSDKAFHFVDLEMTPPDLNDLRSDALRLNDGLKKYKNLWDGREKEFSIRYPILISLSDHIREWNWKARFAFRDGEVCAVLPPKLKFLGLAIDLGTTKMAGYLIDLESGETLARRSAMNPQIHYGEDVISRIFYCMEHVKGRKTLQERVIEILNKLIDEMCTEIGCLPEQIVEAVVVGNTAMHHLFAGLPVRQLGLLPFVPAVSAPLEIPSCEIKLKLSPGAVVYLPANIAGYVGADHVAMVLATETYKAQDTVMAVDIGTNTEISLIHKGEIICCSCASGPAFEGAHIREGMRAAEGAIERVKIDGDDIRLYTIGNQPPVGICGSGILDAIAEMTRSGILNRRGVMSENAPGVKGKGRHCEFVLAPAEKTGIGRDITITRKDIQEILLAKAAIRAGVEILLIEARIGYEEIDRFIVAGAFGTYLDLRSAVEIGMFPNLSLEKFSQVGNAAGSGARQILSSAQARQITRDFAQNMKYVELTIHPSFKEVFFKAMNVRNDSFTNEVH